MQVESRGNLFTMPRRRRFKPRKDCKAILGKLSLGSREISDIRENKDAIEKLLIQRISESFANPAVFSLSLSSTTDVFTLSAEMSAALPP